MSSPSGCAPRRNEGRSGNSRQQAAASVDPNWHSGLKTMPATRRSRSATRWDLENSKTLPDASASSSPLAQRKALRLRSSSQGLSPATFSWPGGVKILPDRRAHSPQPISYPDEWHDVNKSLHETPARAPLHHNPLDQSWMTENFKVLDVPPSRVYDRNRSSPETVHPSDSPPMRRYDDLAVPRSRGRRSPPPPSYFDPEPPAPVSPDHYHDLPLPSDGNWAAESFKVLDASERSSHQHRVYASQSRTGVARFSRDDLWSSGLKTISGDRMRLKPTSWANENLKILEEKQCCSSACGKGRKGQHGAAHRPEFVITNTGWDSGLYKTIRDVRRTYNPSGSYPWLANKSFTGEELRPKRALDATGTGWDSGLKALPATSSSGRAFAPRAGAGYWDVENRKTLSPSSQSVGGVRSEYRRFVEEPRRQDMLAFHRQMCGVY